MSWRPEVQTDNTGKWYGNALRFATEQEALASAKDLAGRWLSVTRFRATQCEDLVNYRYIDHQLVRIEGAVDAPAE